MASEWFDEGEGIDRFYGRVEGVVHDERWIIRLKRGGGSGLGGRSVAQVVREAVWRERREGDSWSECDIGYGARSASRWVVWNGKANPAGVRVVWGWGSLSAGGRLPRGWVSLSVGERVV
jgi:hypothetical protein